MARKFIIGLSILFYALSGIVFFKTLTISAKNTLPHDNSSIVKSKDLSPESEDILSRFSKKQVANRALVKELRGTIAKLEREISNKNKGTQGKNDKYIMQKKSDRNIDNTNKFPGNIKVDDEYASRLVYTVQIYSVKRIADAQKQFNFTLQSLNKRNLNLLRIEKVGEYYTVRLGKFESHETAIKFLKEIKPRLSEAIIMKAYIKNERIVKLYK
jgi:hypothetical protein